MSDPFRSRTELRGYVEAELTHTGFRDRVNLSIAFQDARPLLDPPPLHELWWTIQSSKMDRTQHLISRHYLLEARYDERQFVIWFGTHTGFIGPSPRDVIRPAVHLTFPNASFYSPPRALRSKLAPVVKTIWAAFERAAKARGTYPDDCPEEHSLGAVLSWMLEHEDHANSSLDPMVYPLSGSRY